MDRVSRIVVPLMAVMLLSLDRRAWVQRGGHRAKMAAAPGQADNAVRHGASYVTIPLGANDLCASSPETMTSTKDFQTQFERALKP